MRTIYKTPMRPHAGNQMTITVPKNTLPLAFQNQGGLPCLWYEVDEGAPKLSRLLVCLVGTGHLIPADYNWRYLGTAQFEGGALVLHAYVCLEN